MPLYLTDIPLAQALDNLQMLLNEHGLAGHLDGETLPVSTALTGRILIEPVMAKRSSPHYHAAAMDGFAVKAADTFPASERKPIRLEQEVGFQYVDTGDPLPRQFNAVIPIEVVDTLGLDESLAEDPRQPHAIRVRQPVAPWQHIRPLGEDIIATEMVLTPFHLLTPPDLGAIIASGNLSVDVIRRPRVAIIPTGTELIPFDRSPQAGEILEFNSIVLQAQLEGWGAEVKTWPIIPDDLDKLSQAVKEAAAERDLVLINAGSSAGKDDHTAQIIESLGEVRVHGVAVRPGHPVIIGKIDRPDETACPVIGVPGYPVSAALTLELFVKDILMQWTGKAGFPPEEIPAYLTRKVVSSSGDDEYLRVVTGQVGDRILAAPLSQGAGVITSLARADGLVHIPAGTQGYPAGGRINVRLLKPAHQVNKTIFVIGSHDISLDLMGSLLARHDRRLNSTNVGSLAGLIALNRGDAHLAGSHLLDPKTGDYNTSFIKRHIPNQPVSIFGYVNRQQGLIVRPGNPLKIRELKDLANPDIHFINRQRGAGTRVLLDYHLSQLEIEPEEINGYEQEEYTHLTCAAAVASGRADAALGIQAAATALELDFVPIYVERYDIIVADQFVSSDLLKPFFDLLSSAELRKLIAQQPGYDPSPIGVQV